MDPANIGYYFSSIGKDIGYLVEGRAKDSNEVVERVASLALRILGGLFVVSAAVSFVASIALAPTAPAAASIGIISAIFTAIIAHDLIRVGDNARRIHEAKYAAENNFFGLLFAPDEFGHATRSVAFELTHGISYSFRETIILGPMAKFIKSL